MESTYNILGDIMIDFKKLLYSLAIPLAAGGLGSFIGGTSDFYSSINKPNFAPPGIVFPIVWSILYILMGISYYLIITSPDSKFKKISIIVYFIQLILNVLWPLIFFKLRLFLLGFFWIITLIILVSYMIYSFFKVNKTAAYLQIPYLLWLIFASILSFAIFKMQ